ncbi:MAG: hypothetical protein ACQET5_09455 [Halobacteriota archaeon]
MWVIMTALLVLVVRTTVGTAHRIDVFAGLLVPVTVFAGPIVPIGAAVGIAAGDLVSASAGAWTVVDALYIAALPLGVVALWDHTGLVDDSEPPGVASPRALVAYLFVATVTSTIALAASAWLLAVMGAAPFYVDYLTFVTGIGIATGTGALALGTLGALGLLDPSGRVDARALAPDSDRRLGAGRLAVAFLVAAGWFAVGSGLAAMTHDIRLYGSRPDVVAYTQSMVGPGPLRTALSETLLVLWSVGDVLVVALGVAALVALGLLLSDAGVSDNVRRDADENEGSDAKTQRGVDR